MILRVACWLDESRPRAKISVASQDCWLAVIFARIGDFPIRVFFEPTVVESEFQNFADIVTTGDMNRKIISQNPAMGFAGALWLVVFL